jgi:CRP/FNR family cyclic AMP-dependent transcriptional regulator
MPDLDASADFLARVPLFRGLKQRQIANLAGSMVPRQYAVGETIVTQGKEGIGLFVLVTGKAEVQRLGIDGSTATLNVFGPTDFFGELALLDGGPHTASVVATEETECLVLAHWEFVGKLKLDPEMVTVILQEVVRRFHRALDAV